MVGSPANQELVSAAEASAKRVKNTREREATKKSKESRRRNEYSKQDNSIAACKAYSRPNEDIQPDETDDIPSDLLEELKNNFTKEDIDSIEWHTREQGASDLWKEERTRRLTASKVGGVAKMRKKTKRSGKVKELLYSTFNGNRATGYGCLMEEVAMQEYEKKHGCVCGWWLVVVVKM